MIKERNDKTTSNIIYTSAYKELYNMYFDEDLVQKVHKSFATIRQLKRVMEYTLLKHRQNGIKGLNA